MRIFKNILFFILWWPMSLWAMNIYVDQTIGQDSSAAYNPATRLPTGGSDQVYRKLQDALNAMSGGDDIILRGGTYTNTLSSSQSAVFEIATSKNGSIADHSSISSYTGEWAVLDGEHQELGQWVTLGHKSHDTEGGVDLKYWDIIRIEIKGGGSPSGSPYDTGAGFWANGGPITMRYCYINDNLASDEHNGDENPAGVVGVAWQDSLVEYCYFKNNGGVSTHNCAHICIYSDYDWSNGRSGGLQDPAHCRRSNTFRYNLFEGGSYVGIKHKGRQYLTDGSDMTYKDGGDKVHHNIFINLNDAVLLYQDYNQVYNNISYMGAMHDAEQASTSEQMVYGVFYNNTVIMNLIKHPLPYGTPVVDYHPYFHAFNNIVDSYTKTWNTASITVGYMMASAGGSITMTNCTVDRNFIYRPNDIEHFAIGRGIDCTGFMTTSEKNTCYSVTNYTNSTAGLYQDSSGADQYKTNGSFVIEGATTVTNGGIGGAHPYLGSVTLPSYIGAVNPNGIDNGVNWDPVAQNPDDAGWVDYILNVVGDPAKVKNVSAVINP